MKLFELQSFEEGGLVATERGTPSPCLGEVVIKVEAASINFSGSQNSRLHEL